MSLANLYSIIDTEAQQVIGPPMLGARHAVAVRQFTEMLGNRELITGQYPQHFVLWWIAIMDTTTGKIIAPNDDGEPVEILKGTDWIKNQQRLTKEPERGVLPGDTAPYADTARAPLALGEG